MNRISQTLERTTGYRLSRARLPLGGAPAVPLPPPTGERLLRQPVFVLSTVRSGSTLLRVLLDSHSQIHSPHETHLRDIRVQLKGQPAEKAVAEADLTRKALQHVLWDWYLHRLLVASGKSLLVNKTPSDVFIVDDILTCWPDARFIFLLRHPASILASRKVLRRKDTRAQNIEAVLRYAEALEAARAKHPGHTLRYEDLAEDPARHTQELCSFLGVPWEPSMLEYGKNARTFTSGLGDWSSKIRSGEVQKPKPLPPASEVPDALLPVARAWGYL